MQRGLHLNHKTGSSTVGPVSTRGVYSAGNSDLFSYNMTMFEPQLGLTFHFWGAPGRLAYSARHLPGYYGKDDVRGMLWIVQEPLVRHHERAVAFVVAAGV